MDFVKSFARQFCFANGLFFIKISGDRFGIDFECSGVFFPPNSLKNSTPISLKNYPNHNPHPAFHIFQPLPNIHSKISRLSIVILQPVLQSSPYHFFLIRIHSHFKHILSSWIAFLSCRTVHFPV